MSAKPPSKTQVLNTIAEQTGLKKQDVVSVLDSLGSQISSALILRQVHLQYQGYAKL